LITKFGKRFLTSYLAGMISSPTKDLAFGISEESLISSVSASSGTITYTTSSAHGLSSGNKVSIINVNPIAYNLSNVTVNSVTSTSFTVINSASGTYVSGGNVVSDVNTRLGFEFYRIPASFGSIDIQTDGSGNSTYSVVYQATIPQDVSGIIKEIGLYPSIKDSVNNYDSKFIADFENNLMWFKSDGSNPELVETTTSSIKPRVGSYFSKVSVSASQSVEFTCAYSGLDMSGYTASDSLSFAYNQQDTNLESIAFRFYSSDSSYYTATFTGASSVTQPNKIAKVLFSTLAANNVYADLASIIKIGVVITAKSSGQAVVYLDALRIDDEDTFNANFGLISRSVLSSPVEKVAGKPVDIEYRINLGF
jgi:hypothetical protein